MLHLKYKEEFGVKIVMRLIAFPSFVIKSIFNEALGGGKERKEGRKNGKNSNLLEGTKYHTHA